MPSNKPTWEDIQQFRREVEKSGQMYRGDMPRENYAPPFGQGIPYNSPTNRPSMDPKKPTWRHRDGTIATPEEVEEFFGKDLERNPNVSPNQQGIDWDRIRKTPLRRRKEDLFDELDKRTRGTDKYEGTHPIYRGEKQELSNPIYKGEPQKLEYATKPNRQQQWELLRSLMGR